jgi:hypothetical protein
VKATFLTHFLFSITDPALKLSCHNPDSMESL